MSAAIAGRFSRVRENVAELLDRFPWLEDKPDAVLVRLYWRYYDGAPLPRLPMKKLEELTNPETIIRRRRELGVMKK